MDPRILEKAYTPPAHTLELLAQYGIGTRNRLNRIPKTIERMMSPGGAIERAIFSGIINLEAFEIELNRLRERGLRESDIEEFRLQLETMNRAIPYRQRGNLHPSLPLLQLFLATLLPWYQIDRSYYNPSSS